MIITLKSRAGDDLIIEDARGGYGFYGVGAPATLIEVSDIEGAKEVKIGKPIMRRDRPATFNARRMASAWLEVDGVQYCAMTKSGRRWLFLSGGQEKAYIEPEPVSLKDGQVIGVESVFKRASDGAVVKVTKVDDIRYGVMYTPLGPRGASLKNGAFTGEVIEVEGLDQYYDRLKVDLARLERAGWVCLEVSDKGANIRLD